VVRGPSLFEIRTEIAEMFYKAVAAAVAATIAATMSCMPADARAKPQKRYEVQRPAPDARRSQTPSLDGRITGRSRTCGFDTFQYDGFGVPYGPYCH
jgi:hypothetical protein